VREEFFLNLGKSLIRPTKSYRREYCRQRFSLKRIKVIYIKTSTFKD